MLPTRDSSTTGYATVPTVAQTRTAGLQGGAVRSAILQPTEATPAVPGLVACRHAASKVFKLAVPKETQDLAASDSTLGSATARASCHLLSGSSHYAVPPHASRGTRPEPPLCNYAEVLGQAVLSSAQYQTVRVRTSRLTTYRLGNPLTR